MRLDYKSKKQGWNSVSYISGRYGRNGWMGEAFTNIYPLSTNSITLTAGTYVLQCSAGTVGCSYGTASPNEYVDGVFTSHARIYYRRRYNYILHLQTQKTFLSQKPTSFLRTTKQHIVLVEKR